MATLVLALLLFAPQQPERSAEQKQVEVLIAQIRRLAASEPAIYGVDTRLRTAEAVAGKYPKLARELLHDAEAELSGVNLPDGTTYAFGSSTHSLRSTWKRQNGWRSRCGAVRIRITSRRPTIKFIRALSSVRFKRARS